jgi:hypothetical protein
MSNLPTVLSGLPIHWRGVDDSTPAGCESIVTDVLGISTTYIVRDEEILGRIEYTRDRVSGYAGSGLKGGYYLGTALTASLAERIVARADADPSARA